MEELKRYNKLCIKNKKLLSQYEKSYNQHLFRYNEIRKKFGFSKNNDNKKYDLLNEPEILLDSIKSIYDKIKNFTDKTDISNDSKTIIDNIKSLSRKFDDIFGNIFREENKEIEHFVNNFRKNGNQMEHFVNPITIGAIAYRALPEKQKNNLKNTASKVVPQPAKDLASKVEQAVPQPVKDLASKADKVVAKVENNVGKTIKDNIPGIAGIQNLLTNAMSVFDNILDVFNRVFTEITSMASKVASVIEKILGQMFNAMIYVFKFIKEKLIYYIELAIQKMREFIDFMFNFIKKNLPNLFNNISNAKYNIIMLYKKYKPIILRLIKNFPKTVPITITLFIFIYINLRTATKYITGIHDFAPPPLVVPIPFSGSIPIYLPSLNFVITFVIVAHTIVFHNNKLIFVSNLIGRFFKNLFKQPFIKKLMKFKKDKKGMKDKIKGKLMDMSHIVILFIKNLPKIILFVIVILIVLKTLMNKSFRSFIYLFDNKVSNSQF